MQLKDTKISVNKIKSELIKTVEAKQKKLTTLLDKNTKAIDKAKKKLLENTTNTKVIERELKSLISSSLLLEGAKEHLKTTLKTVKSAIKAKPEKAAIKKPATNKKKSSVSIAKSTLKKPSAKKKNTTKTTMKTKKIVSKKTIR